MSLDHDALTDEQGERPKVLGPSGRKGTRGRRAGNQRNQIERFFHKLERFRRVTTRDERLLMNDMGFVTLAAIAILLR